MYIAGKKATLWRAVLCSYRVGNVFFSTEDRLSRVSVTFDFVLKSQNLNEKREAKGHSNCIITLCLAPDPAIGCGI